MHTSQNRTPFHSERFQSKHKSISPMLCFVQARTRVRVSVRLAAVDNWYRIESIQRIQLTARFDCDFFPSCMLLTGCGFVLIRLRDEFHRKISNWKMVYFATRPRFEWDKFKISIILTLGQSVFWVIHHWHPGLSNTGAAHHQTLTQC